MAGDLDAAIETYRRSIATCPTAEAHTFLGWTYSFQGRPRRRGPRASLSAGRFRRRLVGRSEVDVLTRRLVQVAPAEHAAQLRRVGDGPVRVAEANDGGGVLGAEPRHLEQLLLVGGVDMDRAWHGGLLR